MEKKRGERDPLKKTISFRPTDQSMDTACATFLQYNLIATQQRNDWINKACMFYYNYEQFRKGFLIKIIQENFSLCKHILRQIGRAMSK